MNLGIGKDTERNENKKDKMLNSLKLDVIDPQLLYENSYRLGLPVPIATQNTQQLTSTIAQCNSQTTDLKIT